MRDAAYPNDDGILCASFLSLLFLTVKKNLDGDRETDSVLCPTRSFESLKNKPKNRYIFNFKKWLV